MQWQHIGYGIRGFYRVADYALRCGMVSKKAQIRFDILSFWDRHGTDAACEAFKVSRRTLYRWKGMVKNAGGKAGCLTPRSSAPRRRRKRCWPPQIVDEIRRLRKQHPNLGKAKLHSRKKERKPKNFKANWPGHLIAFDTVERVKDGCRRYIPTMTDIHTRICMGAASNSRTSRAAKDFLAMVMHIFPEPIHAVLSDNGSEFHGEFAKSLQESNIKHWYIYPKSPKMNAHLERFNRTIQEEFVDYNEDLLFEDLFLFNEKMADYIIWFNRDRPHYSLGQISPLQYLVNSNQKCQRYRTHTPTCIHGEKHSKYMCKGYCFRLYFCF
ncbi:MAG: integrase core domain-containing protein [Nitrospinota bacterium]